MMDLTFLRPLEKVLRFYAGLYLAVILFQIAGVMMYVINVWPRVRPATPAAVTVAACLVLGFGFLRALLWVRIYWYGARALSLLRADGESPGLADRLVPVLTSLTGLLVASCVLDFLFLPGYLLADSFFALSFSGIQLGMMETARLLFPQAFGLAVLILAFLTHQYGQLLREQSRMREELELTV